VTSYEDNWNLKSAATVTELGRPVSIPVIMNCNNDRNSVWGKEKGN
jgi:hypothetical protein